MQKSELGVLIIGLNDDSHVSNISIEDSRFDNVSRGGNDIRGARGITFRKFNINGQLVK